MAGSYLHLWLAARARAAGLAPIAGEDVAAAFRAGVMAPDLGFFPGGPRPFSDRVHGHGGRELLAALWRSAATAPERAFAAGWGLHIVTDLCVHPLIDRLVQALGGPHLSPEQEDLWHRRIEWGIDCRVLAVAPMGRHDLCLLWPRRQGRDLLARVAASMGGAPEPEREIRRGQRAVERWLARLPGILACSGQIPSRGMRILLPAAGRVLRRLILPAARQRGWLDIAAVLDPHPADAAALGAAFQRGRDALDAFRVELAGTSRGHWRPPAEGSIAANGESR